MEYSISVTALYRVLFVTNIDAFFRAHADSFVNVPSVTQRVNIRIAPTCVYIPGEPERKLWDLNKVLILGSPFTRQMLGYSPVQAVHVCLGGS